MDKTSEEIQLDELEKSWNDSKSIVRSLLGEDVEKSTDELEDTLLKSTQESDDVVNKQSSESDDNDNDDDDDDDDDDAVKKSLEDNMDSDVEAATAMDVEPFLRQMVKSISEQFDSVQLSIVELAEKTDNMLKAMESMDSLQKATAQLFLNYGELQKGMADTIEAIGNAPRKSNSILRKGGDRFPAQKPGIENMTKDEIMLKATHLREEGKLQVRDITKLENRLNKGMDVPENIQKLLVEKEN